MTGTSILIVDDDPLVRLAYAKVFAKTDFNVQAAESAEEAVQIMRAAPAHILFMDLDLPGMNGLELCQLMRRNWPEAVRIAVTGYASVFERVKCREMGFDDYFVKPVSAKQLLGAAKNAVQKIERRKERQHAAREDD